MKKFALVLILFLLCSCGTAKGESPPVWDPPAAEMPEDFSLCLSYGYSEDSKSVLDTAGTVCRGGMRADWAVTDDHLARIWELFARSRLTLSAPTGTLTSRSLKAAGAPLLDMEPLCRYELTVTGNGCTYTYGGDATAWSYVDSSETARQFCSLCDALAEVLAAIPEFSALPEPAPVQ